MRLHQIWTSAALAAMVLTGAAFADVTVSQSNDPSATMGAEFASLLRVEKKTVKAVSPARLNALAVGPKVEVTTTKGKAPVVKPVEYTEEWLLSLPKPSGDDQWMCLKTALYFEARGESLKGQFAVAEVILNRVDSPQYPTSVCGVVTQRGGGSCQFSFNCDGQSEVMAEAHAAELAGRIARVMLDDAPRSLTAGATHFHTRAVRPGWSRKFDRTAAIGHHFFYKQN